MDPLDSGVWFSTADGVIGKYCNSGNPTLIMANQDHAKYVSTKDLILQPGDVIQFRVSVTVSGRSRGGGVVRVQGVCLTPPPP